MEVFIGSRIVLSVSQPATVQPANPGFPPLAQPGRFGTLRFAFLRECATIPFLLLHSSTWQWTQATLSLLSKEFFPHYEVLSHLSLRSHSYALSCAPRAVRFAPSPYAAALQPHTGRWPASPRRQFLHRFHWIHRAAPQSRRRTLSHSVAPPDWSPP